AMAREAHNAEGTPLDRLLDQLQSLITKRYEIQERSAQGNFSYPIEEPAGSGNFVEAYGHQVPCQASQVPPIAGRTYAELRATLGEPAGERVPGTPGSPKERTRLTWTFGDGSAISIDIPGPENASPYEINRNPHADRTAQRPNTKLHLSDTGI